MIKIRFRSDENERHLDVFSPQIISAKTSCSSSPVPYSFAPVPLHAGPRNKEPFCYFSLLIRQNVDFFFVLFCVSFKFIIYAFIFTKHSKNEDF